MLERWGTWVWRGIEELGAFCTSTVFNCEVTEKAVNTSSIEGRKPPYASNHEPRADSIPFWDCDNGPSHIACLAHPCRVLDYADWSIEAIYCAYRLLDR